MNVFILGGTGSIGTAIVKELSARSHGVVALSRGARSDETLQALGAQPLRGDLRAPDSWADAAVASDAIIQVAATFEEDMGEVDAKAMSALIDAATRAGTRPRLLYTGGCWLYGRTGDEIAAEDRPFDPLAAFSWMVEHGRRLLDAPALSVAIVHPAMVYHEGGGGVVADFVDAAKNGRRMEVWGSPDVRWPLIERGDLARAYCDLAARPELVGHFNAVAEQGVRVGAITRAIAQAYGVSPEVEIRDVDDLVAEYGAWAIGPTLDQQMSGAKLRRATGWAPRITEFTSSAIITPGRP